MDLALFGFGVPYMWASFRAGSSLAESYKCVQLLAANAGNVACVGAALSRFQTPITTLIIHGVPLLEAALMLIK